MYLIFYRTPEDEKVKEWKYGSTKEELKKYAEEQGLDKDSYGIAIEEWEYRDLLNEIEILRASVKMLNNNMTGLEENIDRISKRYSKGE